MKVTHALLIAALVAPAFAVVAQDRDQARERTQDRTREQIRDRDIYGYQMMTPQEREEFRDRMRAAQTQEERGITLPEQPPARGMGGGMGPSGGMGPGGGMGRGR